MKTRNGIYKIKKQSNNSIFYEYPSVTTILGLLNKPFLFQWGINMAISYLEKNYNILKENPSSFFEKAKYAWKVKRDQTADIGSQLHNLIEIFINIKIKNKKIDYDLLLKHSNKNLKQMFWQFFLWQKKNVKEWLKSEHIIYHEELCYAGTCDIIVRLKDNNIWLIDLKTSNALYGNEKIQISAYKEAAILCDNYNINKIGVLRISRDFFDLEFKDFTLTHEYNFNAFKALLLYYYAIAKRKLNNYRAKERL